MNIIEAISKRIKYYLDLNGWSIYKLSRKTGLSPNGIQVIMQNATHNIKLTTIILIAHAFGVTLSEFLNGDDFLYEKLNINF